MPSLFCVNKYCRYFLVTIACSDIFVGENLKNFNSGFIKHHCGNQIFGQWFRRKIIRSSDKIIYLLNVPQ